MDSGPAPSARPGMTARGSLLRGEHRDASAARSVLRGGRHVDAMGGEAHVKRSRAVPGRHLLHGMACLDVDDNEFAVRRRMVIVAKLVVDCRATIASQAGAIAFDLAAGDVEDREIAAGLGR